MIPVVFLVICAGVAWFLVPFAYRKLQERRLGRLCRAQRSIVLTYDDGPGERLTPELLDFLKDHGAHATFFQIGRRIDGRAGLVRRALAEGHEIGSHTQDHGNAWKTGPRRAVRDMIAGAAKVTSVGGQGTLFRPPYGKLTLAGLIAGRRHGLRYAWWTIDSQDSWKPRPVGDVVAEIEARGGGVVLMHDFDQPSRPLNGFDHKAHVLALTERILELARREGYHLKTLGNVLSQPGPG